MFLFGGHNRLPPEPPPIIHSPIMMQGSLTLSDAASCNLFLCGPHVVQLLEEDDDFKWDNLNMLRDRDPLEVLTGPDLQRYLDVVGGEYRASPCLRSANCFQYKAKWYIWVDIVPRFTGDPILLQAYLAECEEVKMDYPEDECAYVVFG